MRDLIFIHGRSQEGYDALALKHEWIESWKKGLALSNLTVPLPLESIHFPYYGDTLKGLVDGATGGAAAEVIVMGNGGDVESKRFIREFLEEVRVKAGITEEQVLAETPSDVIEHGPLNWGWVRAIASAIDRHVPGGSGASVALFTNDVHEYLTNPGIRDIIDTGVRSALRPGVSTVVVAHSLGTIVGYNVLRRDGDGANWNVPLYVTVGSPLAVRVIKQRLTPIRHPTCVKHWFNAMDPQDIVALYPLDASRFNITPPIENKTDIDNPSSNQHGIAGYLGDPVVARTIYDAVVSADPV